MKASDPSVKMIRTRRLWRRLGFAAVLMAFGWILFARLNAWNNQGELRLAQQEIARGELASAHRRLAALAARPGSLSGAANYWLGVTESLAGRPQAALEAFGQVPKGFAFGPVGAYHEARANLAQGKLLAAEQRLEQVLARGGSGVDQIRDLLGQIYQIEVRSDDVSALLGAALADTKDPIPILKKLNNRELDRLPYSGLQAALEKAS
jgi:enediyne biosynthesis protein E4